MTIDCIIHGHFYQPPRENPWTCAVEREPSAAPFHDWNERIDNECYRANAFARIVDDRNRIEQIVNNYVHLSFNFGPTLLSWLERHDPVTYRRILEADRQSVRLRGGHGNAIAQAYNHAILPLSNERDRRTQVRWGVADFRHRFGRAPESLWLAETACNDATLDLLIDENIQYVILSPYQAERVRRIGESEWRNVGDGSIDPRVPYRRWHRDGSGRSIAIFFYDGPIARSIAFEGALSTSQTFVDRLLAGADGGGKGYAVNVATDGETYGHHHHFGDRSLAYALVAEGPRRGLRFVNYGQFLDENPPSWEVEIKPGPDGEGTAWSCAHGVGRWYRDCGCSTSAREGWNQKWRTPLRLALDRLRDEAINYFKETAGEVLVDPWAARDDYIELLLEPHRSRETWLARRARRPLGSAERVQAFSALEMQKNALLMYTSCGWFFADISGIETVQVLKYAARVIDLFEEQGLDSPRERFLEVLADAQSNVPEHGNGADVFNRLVEPVRVSPRRVAVNLAFASLVEEGNEGSGKSAGYAYQRAGFQKQTHGRLTLATAHYQLEELATGRRFDYGLAAMHLGGIDFHCVLKNYPGAHRFQAAVGRLWSHFRSSSLLRILRMTQEEFGPDEFGLDSIFPEDKQRILESVFGSVVRSFAEQYVQVYEHNQRLLETLEQAGFELPPELRAAAQYALARRFEEEIRRAGGSHDPADYKRVAQIADDAAQRGYALDRAQASRVFGDMIAQAVTAALVDPSHLRAAIRLVEFARRIGADERLDRPQEIVFDALEAGHIVSEDLADLAAALGLSPRIGAEALVPAPASGAPPSPSSRSLKRIA